MAHVQNIDSNADSIDKTNTSSAKWYEMNIHSIFEKLKTSDSGISQEEATRRLQEYGPNTLPETKSDSVLMIFLRQFESPLIYLLLVASAIVFVMGEMVDSGIILFVLVFNAIVGSVQEGRAQNTINALKKFSTTNATVCREGNEIIIPDTEIVVGDVFVIREGDKVPADARIIYASGLKVDEASITGESESVSKTADVLGGDTALSTSDWRNMLIRGTNVVSGNGRAIVVATGAGTILGKIAKEITTIDSEIPLKANIRHLSNAIIAVVAGVSLVLFALGMWRGEEFIIIFKTIVSLAVSIIPEGLPIVMTLVLATGVWRMSKKNALVKKLQAVEALGQAQVIAVDKTGTITKNELVVREAWAGGNVFTITGVGYDPKGFIKLNDTVVDAANHNELLNVGKISAMCSGARVAFSEQEGKWMVSGDPTEAATRVFAEKVGFVKDDLLRELPIISETPFDYSLKFHAVVYDAGQSHVVAMQGAPEEVLTRCEYALIGGKISRIDASTRAMLEAVVAEMSNRGLRVVACAMIENASKDIEASHMRDMTLVGLLGMQDVLRAEVGEAISRSVDAGIRVVMITGDHSLTAIALAREVGIWQDGDKILTGIEIDSMSDAQLAERVGGVSVFARVIPEHKLRIINAYKIRKEIIAMTGDGVNDAPSLVAADLGVSMGKIGTDVAKEASDIVLLDDNFGSIVFAIEEGRNIYKTIKKVILYLFSTSIGEVMVIIGALAIGYPLPVLAAQIIWLNFVTDGFLDISLAMEPKESGLMSGNFHKPNKYIIDGKMVYRMIFLATPMVVGTLFVFGLYFQSDMAKALTMSLTTLAIFQWFNAWNCRSETLSIFGKGMFANKYLIGATAMVAVLHLLAIYTPFLQSVLHTVPLNANEWAITSMVAVSVILAEESRKFVARIMRKGIDGLHSQRLS